MTKDSKVTFIEVSVQSRDGLYVATCDALRELFVVGKNLADVEHDIPLFVKRWYATNMNLSVEVDEMADPQTFNLPEPAIKTPSTLKFWASPAHNEHKELLAA